MKYIAIIDEEMLSNFRIDEPPCYMPEDDKILVVKDELGYTRGIQLKPLPKGHGKLIDADSLIKAIEEKAKRLSNADTINGLCGAVALIFDAPTIIDKESEVENDK